VAAWTNFQGAAIRAILEFAERHFLLVHWLRGDPLSRVDAASLPDGLRWRIDRLDALGLGKVDLLLSPSAPIPCVYAVLRGTTWPAFHLAGAAHVCGWTAAQKALDELANAILFCEAFHQKAPLDDGDVQGAFGHYVYYHDPRRLPVIDAWLGGPVVAWDAVSTASLPELDASTLGSILERHLGEITLLDLTCPEARAAGLHVVRAIARDGVPLWFGLADLPLEKPILRDLAEDRLRCRWIHPMG